MSETTKVHAVLLVPHEGDPLKLCTSGPCGATPPLAVRVQCFDGGHTGWRSHGNEEPRTCECPPESDDGAGGTLRGVNRVQYLGEDAPVALVLAWEGKPVGSGCWAAADCCAIGVYRLMGDVQAWLRGGGVPESSFGTIVLLDEHGAEVNP